MKVPSIRSVAQQLRDLNEAYDGPGGVSIHQRPDGPVVSGYEFREGDHAECGYEEIPGDGQRFDAVGAARRLLAAFRDRGVK